MGNDSERTNERGGLIMNKITITLKDTMQSLIDDGYQLKINKRNRIPFSISRERYEYKIDDVGLPTRIYKAAVRGRVKTVGELIDFLNSADPTKLEKVGAKTIKEGRMRLLEWNWEQMDDIGKARYIQTLFA